MSSEPEFDDDPILLPLFGGGSAPNGQARPGRVRSTFTLTRSADPAASGCRRGRRPGHGRSRAADSLHCS